MAHAHAPQTGPLAKRPDLPPEIERWRRAHLISDEQAEAIASFEESRRPARKVPLLTEALGYVGGIIAFAGGSTALGQVWEDLDPFVRTAIFGAAAATTAIAGQILRTKPEAALQRLSSVLWAASVAAALAMLLVMFSDIVGVDDDSMPAVAGGLSAIYALTLWSFMKRGLQLLVLFAMGLTAAEGSLSIISSEPEPWNFALVAWAYGIGWFLLGWFDRASPARVALVTGSIVAIYGPSIGLEDSGWLYAVGLVSSAGLMVMSLSPTRPAILAIGSVGEAIYLTRGVVRYFGDTLGVPLSLATLGAVVLIVAVIVGRTSAHGPRPSKES